MDARLVTSPNLASGGAPSTVDAREQAVFAERLRVLNSNGPPIMLVNMTIALVTWWLNRGTTPSWLTDAWLLGMTLMVGVRLQLYWHIAKAIDAPYQDLIWLARRLVAGSAAAGVLWGSTAMLFFHHTPLENQFFAVVVLIGMGAGAVASLTLYMPVFYGFLIPALLPLLLVCLWHGGPVYLALAFSTLVYAIALCYFGGNFSRALVASMALRYENLDLVEELRTQKQQSDEASAAKSRFLAAASHDLRQPVHALALFNSALQRRLLDADTAHIAGQVGAAVEALDRMFDALLDISRLESGGLEVRQQAIDLAPLVTELLSELQPMADDKGLTLEAQNVEQWVYSDPALLERILRNLLTNAVRYTNRGGVQLRCRDEQGSVRIEVADTGIGIAADDIEEIFQEFRQVGNAPRDRAKGLGLGLTIVDRSAKLLGTPVEVSSEPNRGSVFSVLVPRAPMPSGREVALRASVDARHHTVLPAMDVLVLDDEVNILQGMRVLLSDWGCVPTCCATYEAAMATLRDGLQPCAIIADFRLRGASTGYDLIRDARALLGAGLPSVLVTGDIGAQRLREAEAAGIPILRKPVPPAKLLSFLRSAARTAQALSAVS